MTRLVRMLVLGVAACAAFRSPVRAADVVALRLPADTTVDPEGERRLLSIAPDGTVAALAQHTDSMEPRPVALRWSPSGKLTMFVVPPPHLSGRRRSMNSIGSKRLPPRFKRIGDPTTSVVAPPRSSSDRSRSVYPVGVVAGRGAVYVTTAENFMGAYLNRIESVVRWTTASRRRDELAGCAAGPNLDKTVTSAEADGRVAAVFERTGLGSVEARRGTEDIAPYAFVIDANGCRPRGRGTILDIRSAWASGYFDHRITPMKFAPEDRERVAVRWHGSHRVELGDGVAYAVSSHGLAVGATALAGGTQGAAVPQAVAWDLGGRRHLLEATGLRSVAYDVADDGTIVGTLEGRDVEQYAFRRTHVKLERLDDLPHPSGWHFESAYAIENDGTIVGIGTYRGAATAFRWRPT